MLKILRKTGTRSHNSFDCNRHPEARCHLVPRGSRKQRAFWKRNEPGTLIRRCRYSNRTGGGERRAIGRIRKVNLPVGNRVERFDLEGSKRPRRGVAIRGEAGVVEQNAGNGPAAWISPEPGLTGESEVAASRTALWTVQQGVEAAGRKLRSQNGGSETGSRSGGAKGRCERPVPVGTDVRRPSQAPIRCRQKR
jgi:hypothetical protein